MRLIDIHTLELKEFFTNVPPYAILSHTWGNEEVTFQEYLLVTQTQSQSQSQPPPSPFTHSHPHSNSHSQAHAIKRKAGFSKILGACARAKQDRLQYLWCDTNCIDKRSSAELSEAINSMYAWYRDSVVCYAYLADVVHHSTHNNTDNDNGKGSFVKSRWFTRGWTLQELLAPSKVLFFDMRWNYLGDRKDLARTISDVTKIHIGALNDRNTVPEYSIAQRMSWAADRQTSRQEDVAYSLLGIFDINMPLLYGEGLRAFFRLQLEIIKTSDDQSILAWNMLGTSEELRTSALAQTPMCFRFCGSIVREPNAGTLPFAVTNVGLAVELLKIPTVHKGLSLFGLNCFYELRGRCITDTNGQTGQHIIRHFRVMIWLWNSHLNIFKRVHMPGYCFPILDRQYLGAAQCTTPTALYVLTPKPPLHSSLEFPRVVAVSCDPFAAGFAVSFGVGNIHPRIRIYQKVFPFKNIQITYLKPKRMSSISHLLINDGTYSIIMSAAWSMQGSAITWLHTSYYDPGGRTSNQEPVRRELSRLYDNFSSFPPDSSKKSLCAHIHMVHRRITDLMHGISPTSVSSTPPAVFADNESLHDLHSQEVIAITAIFQEQ